ncbi:MAG TPA: zinc-binding dehydrogenase [Gaiellaceae bacterium]|jgi:NADPH:quinone reductase-like Zn-dependent oxidoreductase
MKAATISNGKLVIQEHPDPVPAGGELLIRVRAAGLNNADRAQIAGHYPAPPGVPPDIPGLECAGETEDGRRVMALLGGGGQAELVVVDARHVLDVPAGLDWPQAGGFMEAFCTAHDALFTQAQLQAGERLLVNGAAGGVGVAAVQLGVDAGAKVTANARHHHEELRALGADTDVGGEYDVILELVGGDNLAHNLERLALRGRVVVIGMGAGSRAEIDFGLLMRTRGRISSSTLRSRSADEKVKVVHRLASLDLERFRVPIEAEFPLADVQAAYEMFGAPGKFGKIVVRFG